MQSEKGTDNMKLFVFIFFAFIVPVLQIRGRKVEEFIHNPFRYQID